MHMRTSIKLPQTLNVSLESFRLLQSLDSTSLEMPNTIRNVLGHVSCYLSPSAVFEHFEATVLGSSVRDIDPKHVYLGILSPSGLFERLSTGRPQLLILSWVT